MQAVSGPQFISSNPEKGYQKKIHCISCLQLQKKKQKEKHYGVKTFNSNMATGHKMVMVYPEETPGLLQNDTHTPLSSTK